MLPAAPKTRRNGKLAEDAIDPYELIRRLSVVQAEAAVQELERKRTEWETSLLASRGNQLGQSHGHGHARTQSIPHSQSHKVHKRAKSISLAPNQYPPPGYADLATAPRKQSCPLINRSQYTAAPRRPSLKRDSVLDLETINEDTVVEPSLDNLFSKAAKERRRSSAVRGIDENGAPNITSARPVSRRRSSLLMQKEAERLQLSPCDALSRSRRQSALVAQKRHSRQDELPRRDSRTRSSLLEKLGWDLKADSDQGSDVGDSDAFDSKGSTLRNSWRSSMTGSTSSRRASILKKIDDYWVGKAPLSDNESGVQDIHTDEEDPDVKQHASKISGLLSKLITSCVYDIDALPRAGSACSRDSVS